MKKDHTPGTPHQKIINQQTRIVDVTDFFSKITEAYILFDKDVRSLIDKIPSCTPQQLLDECLLLKKARTEMAILDEQMHDIITLAGGEIKHHSMLREYRIAFAAANMSCNTLYQKLQGVKIALRDTADGQAPL